ncbi:inorganic phosphate transporter [Auriculariales sp. MPI-PUGE-AT-0066]|nr:inorganic phosphate transporter [Auriculariales sp. MPI-PUGE-AT-0066]
MNNPLVTNLVISLGAMQVARKLDFTDPATLLYVRIGYATSQAVALAVYFWVAAKIRAKKDLTTLKYVQPGQAMSGEPDKVVTTTVRDYDLDETSKAIRSVYMAVAMMAFMHIYMKFTQPLFIQGLMGLKNLYEAKVIQIHVLNKPAEGDLKRPFKTAPGLFGDSGPKTDKASVDEAEKAAKQAASKKDD